MSLIHRTAPMHVIKVFIESAVAIGSVELNNYRNHLSLKTVFLLHQTVQTPSVLAVYPCVCLPPYTNKHLCLSTLIGLYKKM